MSQGALEKIKGVPDIVFLIDSSGSMADCISAIASNISVFMDTLTSSDSNGGIAIKNWRVRVIGYRDINYDGADWLIENTFSNDVATVKSQLSSLNAAGGHDEPESLLDALYYICQWPSTGKGEPQTEMGWRHAHDATRVVIVFTDASHHPTYKTADGSEGQVESIIQDCNDKKLNLLLFAPDARCYWEGLNLMDGIQYQAVGKLGEDPQGSMRELVADQANFSKVMDALAKSVAVSSAVEVA